MTQIIEFAAENYHYTLDYLVYQLPLISLMLLIRQHHFKNAKGAIWTLEDKEFIDNLK